MYTLLALAVFIINALFSVPAMAEGSGLQQSLLINVSSNQKSLNAALGRQSLANIGTIFIKVSKIRKSTLINGTINKMHVNAAVGNKSSANTGSLQIN